MLAFAEPVSAVMCALKIRDAVAATISAPTPVVYTSA